MGIFGSSFIRSSIYHLSILLCNWWMGNEIHVLLPCIPRQRNSSRRILYRIHYSTMATNFLHSIVCNSLFHHRIQRCRTRNRKILKNSYASFSCNCSFHRNLFFNNFTHRRKRRNSHRFTRCSRLLCTKL